MRNLDARVERVDSPHEGLVCFTIFDGTQQWVLALMTLPNAFGITERPERPTGNPATNAITALRRHLKPSRLVQIERASHHAVLTFMRAEEQLRLFAESRTRTGRWVLLDAEDKVLLSSDTRIRAGSAWERPIASTTPCDLAALREDTDERWATYVRALTEHHRKALSRPVLRDLARARKTLGAVERDLDRARDADRLQQHATLLVAHLHEIAPGTTAIAIPDWESPNETIELELDPKLTAAAQADTWFRKAKRLRRGEKLATKRLHKVQAEIRSLERKARDIAAATSLEAIVALAPEPSHEGAGPLISRAKRAPERLPFRTFIAHGGGRVLVGRGARDNDALTLRHARPSDLWLHARGVPGAHVVVPLPKGKDCPQEVLLDAATLAAHFSDARGETIVDVLYTPRRYVRKKRGSATGVVNLEREKVLALRLEPSRLDRLLASEDRSR